MLFCPAVRWRTINVCRRGLQNIVSGSAKNRGQEFSIWAQRNKPKCHTESRP